MKSSVKRLCKPEFVGLLALVLVMCFTVAWLNRIDNASTGAITGLMICALAYQVFRRSFSVFRDAAIRYVVIIISFWACYEAILGLLQIYRVVDSNNTVFSLTGSFFNPNPYAGFLAVSWAVSLAYILDHHEKSRFLKVITVIQLILAGIIIPATRCRSALCAMIVVTILIMQKNQLCHHFIVKNRAKVMVLLMALAVFLYILKKPSADWRLFQDRISVLTITHNPFWGSGLGHYQGSASVTQMDYFSSRIKLNDGNVLIPSNLSPECRTSGRIQFAFCDALQIGVEAGLFTMIVYWLLVLASLWNLYRRKSPLFYGAVSIQVISVFSYPLMLWQYKLLFALMTGESASDGYDCKKRAGLFANLGMIVVSIVVLSCCIPGMLSVRKDRSAWEMDRYFFNRKEYELYCRYCEDKISSLDCNEDFLMEYGIALSETGDYALSDSVLSVGFKNSGNPSFKILLGDNSILKDDYYAAERYYWDSFCCIPDRLLPLSRLAELYKASGEADCLNNLKEFVDGFHPRIESELTELIREKIKNIR